MSEREHTPVLLEEALSFLDIQREGTYIDGTLGMAGHATEILKRNPRARLIGLDLDETSILKAREYLRPYADRVDLYHADFRYLPDLDIDFSTIRGILLDLGMSSFQLDAPGRGFSHTLEGPLDMRMDFRNKMTAAKILDKYSESKLPRSSGSLASSNRPTSSPGRSPRPGERRRSRARPKYGRSSKTSAIGSPRKERSIPRPRSFKPCGSKSIRSSRGSANSWNGLSDFFLPGGGSR